MAKQRPASAVQFTLESAKRIASVVRSVELSPGNASPLTFDRSPVLSAQTFKLAKYTATNSWPKNAVRPVVFVTANTSAVFFAGVTATAVNRFAIVPGHTGSGTNTTVGVLVSLQKINGFWTVVNAES